MKNIFVEKLVVSASKGTVIEEAMKDSLQLALNEMRVVELTLNGKAFAIDPNEIISDILNQEGKA